MTPLNLSAGKYKINSINNETYDDRTFIVASGFKQGLKACSYHPWEMKYKLNAFFDNSNMNEIEKADLIECLLKGNVLVINCIIELPVIGQIGKRILHFDWDIEFSQEYQNLIHDSQSFEDSFLIDDIAHYESDQISIGGFLTDDFTASQTDLGC